MLFGMLQDRFRSFYLERIPAFFLQRFFSRQGHFFYLFIRQRCSAIVRNSRAERQRGYAYGSGRLRWAALRIFWSYFILASKGCPMMASTSSFFSSWRPCT